MNELSQLPTKSARITFQIACLVLSAGATVIVFLLCGGSFIWLYNVPVCPVYLGKEIKPDALIFIEEQGLVETDETILAYYDASPSEPCSQSEVVILTDQRLIYYLEGGSNTVMPLVDIVDVQHREELGDILTIIDRSNQTMRIHIAPWNGGPEFHTVLMNAWHNATSRAELSYLILALERLESTLDALDCSTKSSEASRLCSDRIESQADEWEKMPHPRSMDTIHSKIYSCQINISQALSSASIYNDPLTGGDSEQLNIYLENTSEAMRDCKTAVNEINEITGK